VRHRQRWARYEARACKKASDCLRLLFVRRNRRLDQPEISARGREGWS